MKLQLQDITLGYAQRQGGRRLLAEHLSLEVPEGELIALLGRNGVGKSTLLRVLAGVRRPLHGEVSLDGVELSAMTARDRARRIAFVTTEQVTVAHLRVREVVAMGRAPYTGWFGTLSEEDGRVVDEALERVGMAAFRDKPLETLSDGERQRVMIARALAQDTPLMLLDEPTAFLDLPNRYQVALLLRDLAHDTGKTVVYSSHDLSTAVQLCDALWVMTARGVAAGAPEDLMRGGALNAMFEGTPLTLTTEGGVRLERPIEWGVVMETGADRQLARWAERVAERCGFRLVTETADAVAKVEVLPDERFIVTNLGRSSSATADNCRELATLLRQCVRLR